MFAITDPAAVVRVILACYGFILAQNGKELETSSMSPAHPSWGSGTVACPPQGLFFVRIGCKNSLPGTSTFHSRRNGAVTQTQFGRPFFKEFQAMRRVFKSSSVVLAAVGLVLVGSVPAMAQSGSRNYPTSGSSRKAAPQAGSGQRAQQQAPLALEGHCKDWLRDAAADVRVLDSATCPIRFR